jgi:hypothetical protein
MVLIRTATSTDSSVVGPTFMLRKILWSPTGAGTFTLKDGNGNAVVVLTPPAAAIVNIDFPEEGLRMLNGSQLTTLTGGGTVQIYGA